MAPVFPTTPPTYDELLRERDEAIEALRAMLKDDWREKRVVIWDRARAVLSRLAPEGK